MGERGVTLSGGQKQRIAIARTLLKDNNILIFDDSLSAVDTETDAQIRAALRHEQKDVTTLIISHRVTTLSQADLILVLENGQITQQGTHAELCSQPGLYQRINSIQNALEEELTQAKAAEGVKLICSPFRNRIIPNDLISPCGASSSRLQSRTTRT